MHLAMACVGCLFNSFFNLFAQFKTVIKSHENDVFLYQFSFMAISPLIMKKMHFILVNCMG